MNSRRCAYSSVDFSVFQSDLTLSMDTPLLLPFFMLCSLPAADAASITTLNGVRYIRLARREDFNNNARKMDSNCHEVNRKTPFLCYCNISW